MWVTAERRGARERAKLELRRRLVPLARSLNLNTGDLIAKGSLKGVSAHRIRELQRTAELMLRVVSGDDDTGPSTPARIRHGNAASPPQVAGEDVEPAT